MRIQRAAAVGTGEIFPVRGGEAFGEALDSPDAPKFIEQAPPPAKEGRTKAILLVIRSAPVWPAR